MKRFLLASATFLIMTSTTHAGSSLDSINLLAQTSFKGFSEDLAAALSYKAVAPAEPLGLYGFDIGFEVTTTKLSNADNWWTLVTSESTKSTLPIPRLHVHKGLPYGVDVGLSYTSVPGSNIEVTGGELRYAILTGNFALPAVAFRVTTSRLSGVDQLAFSNTGYELSVSKGFAFVTPYAGIGRIKTDSKPRGIAAATLSNESFTDSKTYIGVNINFGISNIGLETDKTGDSTSYSIKYGIRW